MIYLIGVTTTDAGVVLVNIFGDFLIQRATSPEGVAGEEGAGSSKVLKF